MGRPRSLVRFPEMRHRFYALILCSMAWAIGCGTDRLPSTPKPRKIVLTGVDYRAGNPSELNLPEANQRELLAAARQICDGGNAPEISPTLAALQRDIIPILYGPDGKRAASERLRGEDATMKRLADHLPALCEKAPPGARLHLLVVGYTARLPNFGIKGVFDQKVFEPMVNGLVYEFRGVRREIDPMAQVERNLGSRGVRQEIAFGAGLTSQKAPAANGLIVEIYRALHIGETRTSEYHLAVVALEDGR